MSTAIVITSGKGGTGKTSITGGVASCLAALGHRVLCIDMDIGLRNLDLTLGLSDRALMDFTDVLCGRCTLERAAVPHPVIQGLFLLTAPVTLPEAPLSEAAMKELIHRAREGYDYILMDSPAGLGEGFRLACCAADRAVVVSTTDASALRDAQRTVSVLRNRIPRIHLVVNRVQPRLLRRLHTTIDDAMDAAGLPLLGIVPEDPQVMLCANQGQPLILRPGRRRRLSQHCQAPAWPEGPPYENAISATRCGREVSTMNIALMSHDRKKELMVQFCIAYCGILSKHTICATNTTGRLVAEATGLPVQLFLSHEHGGSQQIGARIAYNEIDMVLFFSDPQSNDLDADLKYITTLCDQYNIPFATNVATAEILIHGLERGDLDWRDIINPKTKPFTA